MCLQFRWATLMGATNQNDKLLVLNRFEKSLIDLNDVYRKHQNYIRAKYKITSLEMEIIQLIVLEGKKKMKEIGQYFNIKLSTLTSIIVKIERQKLVKRVNSKDDRRVVFLEVTNKGNKLYTDYSKYIQVISTLMKSSMDEENFNAFTEGLSKMSELVSPS